MVPGKPGMSGYASLTQPTQTPGLQNTSMYSARRASNSCSNLVRPNLVRFAASGLRQLKNDKNLCVLCASVVNMFVKCPRIPLRFIQATAIYKSLCVLCASVVKKNIFYWAARLMFIPACHLIRSTRRHSFVDSTMCQMPCLIGALR